MDDNQGITVFDSVEKEKVKAQIFETHGLRVMLDRDIAGYFGVETKALNRAMKRNIMRFPDNYCFQLTRNEYREILRCQTGTLELEQGQYSKYLPYCYSEQGVAMLTSVLHTDRAIEASILIIDAFVEMSHYLHQNAQLLPYQGIHHIENRQFRLEARVDNIEKKMVTKEDLSDLMQFFDQGITSEEILILDGQPFKADVAYQQIYRKAKKAIIVIDDYISVKTLQHLAVAKVNIAITVISDNKGRHPLRLSEYHDFLTEYPGRSISFVQSLNQSHDRYIVLDQGTKDMKVYHCGASSKDAGHRITTITRIMGIDEYKSTIKNIMNNPVLVLK